MKKTYYIKKNRDFRKIYQAGKSLADWLLVVYTIPNKTGTNRYGFSVSKKIGNAVKRNRVKRVLREICRLNNNKFKQGFDIVIIARNPIRDKNYSVIEKSLIKIFKKINIFKEEQI